MTLVEVMVSTVLLSVLTLVLLSSIFAAYSLSAQTRYRDQARYVLTSVSDQFLRAPATDVFHPSLQADGLRDFFAISATPTGKGMSWYGSAQVFVLTPCTGSKTTSAGLVNASVADEALYSDPTTVHGADSAAGLSFLMADYTGRPVQATLTRMVQVIDPATGNIVAGSPTYVASGCILRGDFTLSFLFQNRNFSQSISVLRTIMPPAGK
jgi:type II secretory pathway pseudopilin PulG